MEERLQKILARAGYGSRRASEELIAKGRVTVNGQFATLGTKADPEKDRILVDGRPVGAPEPPVYIALYKPRNVVSTVEAPDPRQTVRDLIDLPGRLYPVGRLDVDSEGLILMTNDGELANRLTHPRYGHEKEYRVLVARRPDEQQLEAWRRGIVLEDEYRTQPAEVRVESLAGKGTWLRVIMKEGRKRQIREIGRLLGLPVVKIIRLRIGTVQLAGLKPREWRYLTPQEVAVLKGEAPPPTAGSRRNERRPSRTAQRTSRPGSASGSRGQGGRSPGSRGPGSRGPGTRSESKRTGTGRPGDRPEGTTSRSSSGAPARRPGSRPPFKKGGKPGQSGRRPGSPNKDRGGRE